MWTNATLTTPADELPVAETLEQLPTCTFWVEQAAFENRGNSLAIWFRNVTADELEQALAKDSSVEDHSRVAIEGEELLYHFDFGRGMVVPLRILQRHDATVETARGSESQWTLEVRFPDREALASASDEFERVGITMNYHSITDVTGADRADQLTEKQWEALQTAIDEGYFKIPREITLEELAEELKVSHQALSERLRRAQETLVESQLQTSARVEHAE